MGESERYIDYRDSYRQPGINFNINSPVVLLVIFNFSIFLFVQFLSFGKLTGDTSVVPFFESAIGYFLSPNTFGGLAHQPWSAITYAFFHIYFFQIVGNMLWLWCFGSILQTVVGNRHTFPLYIYGAIAGALGFIICIMVSPALAGGLVYPSLYGANAAVMAVAIGATTIAPNFKILQQLRGGIPIWILTLIYIAIDIVGVTNGSGAPFYVAHIAGAVIGVAYMLSYKNGYDWGAWMNDLYHWFMNLFNPNKKNKRSNIKEKVFYNTGNRVPYHKTSHITQQRVDEILDKISQKGYNHLNEEEKNILKRASEDGL